jgi:hypothetical protein
VRVLERYRLAVADIRESVVIGYREVMSPYQQALVCELCWAMVPLDAEAAGRHLGWHDDRGHLMGHPWGEDDDDDA